MRQLFQHAWHGIEFRTIAPLSSSKMADTAFYESFYRRLFATHSRLEDLDPRWLALKQRTANYIVQRVLDSPSARVLSIGCGLGVIELELLRKGYRNLHVTETSTTALTWLRPHIESANVHLGFFPDCMPQGARFEFILLSGVDYFFDDKQLAAFLRAVKEYLAPGGKCVMISFSLNTAGLLRRMVQRIWDVAARCLELLHLLNRGQLWGYTRTPEEYRRRFHNTGLAIAWDEIRSDSPWVTYTLVART